MRGPRLNRFDNADNGKTKAALPTNVASINVAERPADIAALHIG
jgi:hypothetical protein